MSPASPTRPDLAADRAAALRLTPVSRETLQRLDLFVETLLAWNAKTNLIAASTVPHLWTRHIADSLQLIDLAPDARVWIDLGSGAGFPGLVIACALANSPGPRSIWSKATPRKPRSCVRPPVSPASQQKYTPNASSNLSSDSKDLSMSSQPAL